ncbi:MAG: adenylate/guanylate cyclase domain-containing protein [Hyphomicrobiales bacterium]|nr:adenylate/guanylate cyclase domain-containing protein [Hyphomicrobiales bacterium]MBV8661844.1 adenylate/guanylate cyclase domain-containing protein [Hyphomicrobiales bacterium]
MKCEAPERADVVEVVRWLVSDDCQRLDDVTMISEFGRRLRALGIAVDRLGLHLRTLHPQFLARSLLWSPDRPIAIFDREAVPGAFPGSLNTLLSRVRQNGEWVIEQSSDDEPLLDWFDVYRGHQVKSFVAAPLVMGHGPPGVAVFASQAASSFTHEAIMALTEIAPALRCACEIKILRRTEATLLHTYVGRATAQRVLDGHIRRGHVETLQAALFMCDLRDFTRMSNRLPPAEVLDRLNGYFDQVVPAITARGGEILKFMGDAVLAFFGGDAGPAANCAAAYDAALEALRRIEAISPPLHAGVALHHGKVAYGNIGSEGRLDFTVIGRDVNLLSRIETACSMTSQPLLMSSEFAAHLGLQRTRSIGRHALKGFTAPAELFAPAEPCVAAALPN